MARSTTTSEKRWTLITMILTSGVVFLSGSVVNVALPKIANALKTRLSGLQWIVDGYLLTLSSLLILGGALGDRFGRRRMCMVGLVGFGLTSLGSGLSPSTGWLIALRALQGISGALMIPESLALIRVVYRDPEARGRAIGAWWVEVTGGRVLNLPAFQNWVNDTPGQFDLIGPGEEGCIALNGIQQKPFICIRQVPLFKILCIGIIDIGAMSCHARPRLFGLQSQTNPLIRLNAEVEDVGGNLLSFRNGEHQMRHSLELNRN